MFSSWLYHPHNPPIWKLHKVVLLERYMYFIISEWVHRVSWCPRGQSQIHACQGIHLSGRYRWTSTWVKICRCPKPLNIISSTLILWHSARKQENQRNIRECRDGVTKSIWARSGNSKHTKSHPYFLPAVCCVHHLGFSSWLFSLITGMKVCIYYVWGCAYICMWDTCVYGWDSHSKWHMKYY